ncbi:TPA: hypothetical protein QDC03_006189 [Burkholderia cepacia]|uniref:hypothetical protein n=1 Tax=Burkholderia cepacia TaxID=292 RepID=UPI0011B26229|nr:hypothetical protein [Burkholderia cepacia]HDR9511000.1 hypothetical protein [Burkholderia cepacia]
MKTSLNATRWWAVGLSATLLCSCVDLGKGMDAVRLSGQPLFRASGFDSTMSSVVAVGGAPRAKTPIHYTQSNTDGVCYDYVISGNGRTSDYYVAFNRNNMTTNAGFIKCADAVSQGIFKEDLPVKVKYCRANAGASDCRTGG